MGLTSGQEPLTAHGQLTFPACATLIVDHRHLRHSFPSNNHGRMELTRDVVQRLFHLEPTPSSFIPLSAISLC